MSRCCQISEEMAQNLVMLSGVREAVGDEAAGTSLSRVAHGEQRGSSVYPELLC